MADNSRLTYYDALSNVSFSTSKKMMMIALKDVRMIGEACAVRMGILTSCGGVETIRIDTTKDVPECYRISLPKAQDTRISLPKTQDTEEITEEYVLVNEPDSIYTGKPFLKTVVTNIFREFGWNTRDAFSKRGKVSVQWDVYENIDWKRAFSSDCLVNGYCNRNGLIRKAHLCATLNKAMRKLPRLRKCVPVTIPVCIDPRPDWFGLSISDITEEVDKDERSLWILKPSRFDRGDDKHVVRTSKECEKALWNGRHLVEWVCQQYIDRPLLVNDRKFHIRANVLAVGALEVFLHTESIIVTTAALPYKCEDLKNPHIHLSNAIFARTYHTKKNNSFQEENFKFLLPRLCEIMPSLELVDTVDRMCDILHDVFKAFETELNGFMPHPNCFELFGVDFMMDENGQMYILEINAGCDNESMFGKRYESQLKSLLKDVVRVAVNRKLRREDNFGAFKSCLSVNLPSYHENLCMLEGNEVRKTTYGCDLVKPEKAENEVIASDVRETLNKVVVLNNEVKIWKGGDEFRAVVCEIDRERNLAFLKYLDDDEDEEMVCDEDEWVRMNAELLDRLIL